MLFKELQEMNVAQSTFTLNGSGRHTVSVLKNSTCKVTDYINIKNGGVIYLAYKTTSP